MGARSRLQAWLRLHLNDAGAALVEFALALPLFLPPRSKLQVERRLDTPLRSAAHLRSTRTAMRFAMPGRIWL